jgi:hypothetical protein
MSSSHARFAGLCVGACCGAISAPITAFASFPYDLCGTALWSSLLGFMAGGIAGYLVADRRGAAISGTLTGLVLGPVLVRIGVCLAVLLGGAI